MRLLSFLAAGAAATLAAAPCSAETQFFATHEACLVGCHNPVRSGHGLLRDCRAAPRVALAEGETGGSETGGSGFLCAPEQCLDDGSLGEQCKPAGATAPVCCTDGAVCRENGCVQQGNSLVHASNSMHAIAEPESLQTAAEHSSNGRVETADDDIHDDNHDNDNNNNNHDNNNNNKVKTPAPADVHALLVKSRTSSSVTLAWEDEKETDTFAIRMTHPIETEVWRGVASEATISNLDSVTEYSFEIVRLAGTSDLLEGGVPSAHPATVTVVTKADNVGEVLKSVQSSSSSSSSADKSSKKKQRAAAAAADEETDEETPALRNKVRKGLRIAKNGNTAASSAPSASGWTTALYLFAGTGLVGAAFVIYRRQTAADTDIEIASGDGLSPLLSLGRSSDLFA